MAKKKTIPFLQELKKLLETKKLVLGSERTIKLLKKNMLKKVILTINCDLKTLARIEKYAELSKVELQKTNYTNERLGTLCKKPFSISVIGVLE
ncbi:50S ribosomal protein L30e [Candidatus Woesearchaeota archaeon CG10_big_fil_rev_8_21_14_0_10_30_7]|nr:MAG: 50S ribosomal protein L30e [Candidatus Woesearchaeota archaeon CG10_big_fil_rev_8_21_14_0_10_30_7]